MTLDLEKFTMVDGQTDLSAAEFNARFWAIVRRLNTLELLSIDWSEAVAQVQNYGLARINDAVQPLIDTLKIDLTNLIAQGQADLVSQSAAVAAKLAAVDAIMVDMAALKTDISSRIAAVEAAQQQAAIDMTIKAKRLAIVFGG